MIDDGITVSMGVETNAEAIGTLTYFALYTVLVVAKGRALPKEADFSMTAIIHILALNGFIFRKAGSLLACMPVSAVGIRLAHGTMAPKAFFVLGTVQIHLAFSVDHIRTGINRF